MKMEPKTFGRFSDWTMRILSLLFLLQSLQFINIIPLNPILQILGISNNIKGIFYSLLVGVGMIFVLTICASILKFSALKKNEIILNTIVSSFMLFITLLPAFFSYNILGGTGILGNTVKSHLGTFPSDPAVFLNLFLFWFLLIRSIIKPEIVPEWGLDKSELNSGQNKF